MGIPLWKIPEIRRFYGMEHGGGYDAWKRISVVATPFDFDKAESVRPKGHCVAVGVTSEDPDDGLKPTSGKVQMLVVGGMLLLQRKMDSIKAQRVNCLSLYNPHLCLHIRVLQLVGLHLITVTGCNSILARRKVHSYVQSHIQINEYRDRVVLPTATEKYGRYIGTCVKVLDMTGLKFSALSQIKLLTVISTIDDLNYPEKTNTYYIVNVPYVFSACWKVVKPLLQERTRRKVQVLPGCGRDELLKIMDYASLPHFCRREGSGSSQHSPNRTDDCFSLDHAFHQQLYNYIKQQSLNLERRMPIKQGSFHVDLPSPDENGTKIALTIESEFHKLEDQNGLPHSLDGLKINGE